jgi:hypothetical protein
MKNPYFRFFVLSFFMIVLFWAPSHLFAQDLLLPQGEYVKSSISYKFNSDFMQLVRTNRHTYLRRNGGKFMDQGSNSSDFIDQSISVVDDSIHLFTLLADGSVMDYNTEKTYDEIKKGNINPSSFEAFEKITGDDMYVQSNQCVYVSRDHAISWNTDTTGIGGAYMYDIALDTSQNAYVATGKGVYKQLAKGGTWSLFSTPISNPSKIFISSKNEFYISQGNRLYKSTDGTTWSMFNMGLNNQYPVKFGQDTAGNVYVITNNTYAQYGNDLYKYDGTKWVSISANIIKHNYDQYNNLIFSNITGGMSLFASTAYGLFRSDDLGATWIEDDNGITADNADGIIVTSNGTKITTTSCGVFYEKPGTNNWVQTLHPGYYQQGQRVFVDKSDVIYTLGELIPNNGSNGFIPRVVYKSTDLGKTWATDTDGISKTNYFRFYVDETGIQYMGGSAGQVYVKLNGQAWKPDTGGLTKYHTGIVNSFGSDKNGTIYLSTSSSNGLGLTFKRSLSGTTWIPDSAGASYHQTIFDFYPDANGNFYAGTYGGGLIKRTSNGWRKINIPIGYDVLAIATNKSGTLFAGLSHSDASYNEIGDGVYITKDTGITWKQISNSTSTFIEFVPDDDTIFGVSYYDGVYEFTDKSSGIKQSVENNKFILYPNPGTGIFHFSSEGLEQGKMELEISDIQGKVICNQETWNAGIGTFDIDLSACNNGMYIYRLIGANGINTGKILLRK